MAEDRRRGNGRIGRSTKLGGVAAGAAARAIGTKAANVVRSDEAADAAMARQTMETADRLVTVLGTMKGAAMKLGQTFSVIDVGLVPEEYREEFQAKLAKLQATRRAASVQGRSARSSSRTSARSSSTRFADFERGADRRRVDRPGPPRDAARRRATSRSRSSTRASTRRSSADLQNLGLGLKLLARISPGLDTERDRRRDPRAHHRGARLRARGRQPPRDGARVPRPPVRRRARRRHRRSAASG